MKQLLIGDIHGCHVELLALLDKAALSDGDEVIALGDIVDRGPDTPKVLEFFRARSNARSLMGNHERKHIRSSRGEIKPALSQIISRAQLGDGYAGAVSFMATFPYFLELPEATLVHGYFEAGVALDQQNEMVLAGTLGGATLLQQRFGERPWYEFYDGAKPLVVGHHDYSGKRQPFVYRDKVFGIDTDCCRGGALTGLLLPEFKLISVRSPVNYWEQTKKRYAASISPSATPASPSDSNA